MIGRIEIKTCTLPLCLKINNFIKKVKNNGYTAGREMHGTDPAPNKNECF
jgi:ribosomal protein S10